MLNARRLTKLVSSAVVGSGTKIIVAGIIESNVEIPEKRYGKIALKSAEWVISAMAATATKQYTDEMIDEIYDAVESAFDDTPAAEAVVESEVVKTEEEN